MYPVSYRPIAACADNFFLMGGLIRQGPLHGVACEIRVAWCIWVVLLQSQVRQQCNFLELAGQSDGTEGSLRPSNTSHGVREVCAPHAWGTY